MISIVAGSKLEAAIAEGPEALQKFINSGEIEELQDVLPHDDEHDYLNDAYLDDDGEESRRHIDNRDADLRHLDQDMRKVGQPFKNANDIDLRGMQHNPDMDFRGMDYDMRRLNNQMTDEDYRMPYNRDQDFRYNDDEDMEDNYEEDYASGYQESRNWHHNQFNQNRFGNPSARNPNFNNGYQNFRNQGRNEPYRQPDDHWAGGGGGGSVSGIGGGGGGENFRGRGGWRGPLRGNPRGGRGNPRQGRGGGPNQRGQNSRGNGPAGRGQSLRGRNNMF